MTILLTLAKLVGIRRLTRATVAIVKWTLLLLLVGGMAFYFWLTGDIDKAAIAVAALAVALGVRGWWRNRHVGIVKWAVRLLLVGLAGWVALNTDIGFGIGRILLYSAGGRITLAALAVALVFVWWLRNRRVETSVGERFIDGKPVPDKLAVAALGLPPQSADIYDVLRGLPDYAKTLLNLDARQFDYRPEEPMVQRAPRPKAVSSLRVAWVHAKIWLTTAPRWAKAAGTAALLLAVGVFGIMMSNTRQAAGEQQRQRELADTQARRAEEILKNGSSPAVPETPPAAPEGTWRDPATGLLWPLKDNGSEVLGFPEAKRYCDSLDVNGLKAWRLPNMGELEAVVDFSSGAAAFRGGIQLSHPIEALWSSTPFGTRAGMYTVLTTWLKGPPKGSTVDDVTHVLCIHDKIPPPETRSAALETSAPAPPAVPVQVAPDVKAQSDPKEVPEMRREGEPALWWTVRDNGHKAIRKSADAQAYCESLHTGRLTGWRLPNYSELESLVSRAGRPNFALDLPSEVLWSSTTYEGVNVRLRFGEPFSAEVDMDEYSRVLCVHD